MTYGIELRNEFDDNLVDITAGQTYYRDFSGTCILSSDVIAKTGSHLGWPLNHRRPGFNGAIFDGFMRDRYASFSYRNTMNFAAIRFIEVETYWDYSAVSPQKQIYAYPEPVTADEDALIFFRMPAEGIISLYHVYFPFTGTDHRGVATPPGLTACAIPDISWSGTGLPYQVVTTSLPPRDSDFGIVVYDEDGSTILFDTSREVASFVDHIEMTQSQVQDVIEDGAVYNFTMRTPVVNAWLTAEGTSAASYRMRYTSSGMFSDTMRIKQTSPTNIEVSRSTIAAADFPWGGALSSEHYEGAFFLIADFD